MSQKSVAGNWLNEAEGSVGRIAVFLPFHLNFQTKLFWQCLKNQKIAATDNNSAVSSHHSPQKNFSPMKTSVYGLTAKAVTANTL